MILFEFLNLFFFYIKAVLRKVFIERPKRSFLYLNFIFIESIASAVFECLRCFIKV